MAITANSTAIIYTDGTTQTTADLGYITWVPQSKTVGTTYTNSTGRPLCWWGTVGNNAAINEMDIRVDGVTITRQVIFASNSQQNAAGFFVVVPNGSTYGLFVGSGSPVLYYWNEA
jgi:asparagine synthetase A